jgi:hypothetical protein
VRGWWSSGGWSWSCRRGGQSLSGHRGGGDWARRGLELVGGIEVSTVGKGEGGRLLQSVLRNGFPIRGWHAWRCSEVHEGNHADGLRQWHGGVWSRGGQWREMAMRRKYLPWSRTLAADKGKQQSWVCMWG